MPLPATRAESAVSLKPDILRREPHVGRSRPLAVGLGLCIAEALAFSACSGTIAVDGAGAATSSSSQHATSGAGAAATTTGEGTGASAYAGSTGTSAATTTTTGTGGTTPSGATTTSSSGGGSAASANLGLACATNSDCGAGLTCYPATTDDPVFLGGPANGYCSGPCAEDSDCPSDGRCYGAGGSSAGRCLLGCVTGPGLKQIDDPIASDGKCHARADVVCSPIDSTGIVSGCLPLCGEDSQCPAGRHCDPQAGVCVVTPATGSPTGSACDPSAATSPCAGSCVGLDTADGGIEGLCTTPCVLGGVVPLSADPNCGGVANGLCLYAEQGYGAGDLGFCAPACASQDACGFPAYWCFPVSGLTGADGGVPNGYCSPGTPCPNGGSDCASLAGTTCAQTIDGPWCLSGEFPLGKASPDGG
jgi:hypothetical protein